MRSMAVDPDRIRADMSLVFGVVLLLGAGCSDEFLNAVSTGMVEGAAAGMGAFTPGRYEVRLTLVKLDADDFVGNDDGGGGPELFVVVKHRGAVVLSTQKPGLVKQDTFGNAYEGVRFEFDWQRGDEIIVEVWDEDIAAHDLLLRWKASDTDAPLLTKRLTSAEGSEVFFECKRAK